MTSVNKDDKNKYNHPTIKPIEIIKNFILNSSNENDVIFDPFLGSGTTCSAAKELGRRFIGFEINPNFYKIAQDRINGIDQKGQMDLFATSYEQLDLLGEHNE